MKPLSDLPSTLRDDASPSGDFTSPMLKEMTSSAMDDSEAEKLPILPPPNPILSLSVRKNERPPESTVKGIIFCELKEFKRFPGQANDALGMTANGRAR